MADADHLQMSIVADIAQSDSIWPPEQHSAGIHPQRRARACRNPERRHHAAIRKKVPLIGESAGEVESLTAGHRRAGDTLEISYAGKRLGDHLHLPIQCRTRRRIRPPSQKTRPVSRTPASPSALFPEIDSSPRPSVAPNFTTLLLSIVLVSCLPYLDSALTQVAPTVPHT